MFLTFILNNKYAHCIWIMLWHIVATSFCGFYSAYKYSNHVKRFEIIALTLIRSLKMLSYCYCVHFLKYLISQLSTHTWHPFFEQQVNFHVWKIIHVCIYIDIIVHTWRCENKSFLTCRLSNSSNPVGHTTPA